MNQQHRPVADATGEFCTVVGCGRLVGIKRPWEHRRGGSRQRPPDDEPPVTSSLTRRRTTPNDAEANRTTFLEARVGSLEIEVQRLRQDVGDLLAVARDRNVDVQTWRDNLPDRSGRTRPS